MKLIAHFFNPDEGTIRTMNRIAHNWIFFASLYLPWMRDGIANKPIANACPES